MAMKGTQYWKQRMIERGGLAEPNEDGKNDVSSIIDEIQKDAYAAGQTDFRTTIGTRMIGLLTGERGPNGY